MAGNLTLAMIKPHVVWGRHVGSIIVEVEKAGFGIVLAKMLQLRSEGAREFYQEHAGKDFFDNLVNVMSTGPVWVLALAKENAVEEWRNTIGATHPAEAAPDTIRARFGDHSNITNNAVHGSATDHDALREINFFFNWELNMALRISEAEGEQIE